MCWTDREEYASSAGCRFKSTITLAQFEHNSGMIYEHKDSHECIHPPIRPPPSTQ